MVWLWLLLSVACNITAEVFTKRYVAKVHWIWMALLLAGYVASSLAWVQVMHRRNQLALMGTLWLVLCCVGTVLVGTVGFDESLKPWQWVGAALAIVAAVLLSL